jgi:hypothetical protein
VGQANLRLASPSGWTPSDAEFSARELVKRLRRSRGTKQSTFGLKPLSSDHEVTAKHRRAIVAIVLVGRDNNAVASGFRRSNNHPLLLAVEHRYSGDGRGVVKSG